LQWKNHPTAHYGARAYVDSWGSWASAASQLKIRVRCFQVRRNSRSKLEPRP
jgi:hypothetical protein